MEKIILTDCDGVLLDWMSEFRIWMINHGYEYQPNRDHEYHLHNQYKDVPAEDIKHIVCTFNESAAIGFLPAFKDSAHYVKRLYEDHGYRFRVITSLSLDKSATVLRESNLHDIFGNAIESVICLDTGASKDAELEQYRDSGMYWIEDKYENFKAGMNLGLNSILVEHNHNNYYDTAGGHRVPNWKEIYKIITKEIDNE